MIENAGDFDVVIIDYHMPYLDGLEATIKIREFENSRNRKKSYIIALTAGAFK